MLPSLSPRQKAGLACALAFLLWLPMGVSHGDATLLTGHSSFYDGDSFSPCLASLAGIMRHRVMWFNDQVLAETYGGKGAFIYVTEQGARDPRDPNVKLFSDGVFYDFVDPNGAHWHVEELYMTKLHSEASQDIDPNVAPAKWVEYDVGVEQNRTYVWTVELAARPIYDEFAGASPHTYYNFLTIVDTCKMHRGQSFDRVVNHTRAQGDINANNGHRNDDEDHAHETFMVDIWVGKRPTVLPAGASTDGAEWESSWAQGEATEENVAGTGHDSPIPEDTADGGAPEAP